MTGEAKSESFFSRHDLLVVVVAALLWSGGYFLHKSLSAPDMTRFDFQGLAFTYPASWLPTQEVGATPGAVPSRTWYQSMESPLVRLEVRIEPKPTFPGPLGPILDLERTQNYGAVYAKEANEQVTKGGREWTRTYFSYAYLPTEDGSPTVVEGTEYAVLNGDRLYVVTLHAPAAEQANHESAILESLTLQ